MGWVRKVRAGLVKIDSSVFVGEDGDIFFDIDDGSLRLSNGSTPGGITIAAGIDGSYSPPTASTTTKGVVKIDGTTIDINNEVISVRNGVVTTGSYSNPSWIADLDYSKLTSAPTALSQFANDTGYVTFSGINLEGGTVNQVLVKKSGDDYDYQWENVIIDPVYTKIIDDTIAGVMYLGEAAPGTATNAPAWRIKKIIFDVSGNVDEVRFAAGGLFSQIWDARISLTYS
jgi:hypothetical protein